MRQRARFFFLVAASPLVIVALLAFLRFAADRNWLPFGFRFAGNDNGRPVAGSVQWLFPSDLQREFPTGMGPGRVVFSSDFFAAGAGDWIIHLSPMGQCTLLVNGARVELDPRQRLQPFALLPGFNRIQIVFQKDAADTAPLPLKFVLRGRGLPLDGAFWRWVLPGRPLSKTLFYLVWVLDRFWYAGFALALLFLLPGLARSLFGSGADVSTPLSAPSGYLWIFSRLVRVAAIFLITVFLTRNLLWPSLLAIAAGSLFVLLVDLNRAMRSGNWNWRPDGRAFLALAAALVAIMIYVHAISGSFLPLEPVGGVDLLPHVSMIKHFERESVFTLRQYWEIYPQAGYALIVFLAKAVGLAGEELLTLFMMATLAGIGLLLYLAGRSLFGEVPLFFFALAAVMSNIAFVVASLFEYSSFPCLLGCFLFLCALLFHLRRDGLSASLALGAAVAVYPYLGPAFIFALAPLLFAGFLRPAKEWLTALWRTLVSLAPAIVLFTWYSVGLLARGYGGVLRWPADEGANAFNSLKPTAVFLFLFPLYLWRRIEAAGRPLRLALGLVVGIAFFQGLYLFKNMFGSYYLRKNAILLILLLIPFSAYGLKRLVASLPRRPLAVVLLSLLLLFPVWDSYRVLHQTRAREFHQRRISPNLPGRPFMGVTATNRWLKSNCPPQTPLRLLTGNGYLTLLLQEYLRGHFSLSGSDGGEAPPCPPEAWVMLERHYRGPRPELESRTMVFSRRDFSIWKPMERRTGDRSR